MSSSSLPPILVLVGLALGVIVWQAIRKPILRRLAVRDVIRRPTESILVVIGALLGTAIITGSFIVGDTLNASVKATAYTQLGPVDELVQTPDPKQAAGVEHRIASLRDPRIDGVMSLVLVQASLTSDASGTRLAEPKAQLMETDF